MSHWAHVDVRHRAAENMENMHVMLEDSVY